MNRRQFLLRASRAGAAAGLSRVPALAAAGTGRPPRILLRSSWQSVNIGDIGHTPGALSLLEKYFPEAEVTLWPSELGHGSRELLTKGYYDSRRKTDPMRCSRPQATIGANLQKKRDRDTTKPATDEMQ